jgi:glycosyltransferase involved in cell wall biosynthesis
MTQERTGTKPWVVFVSTFPPRECGIATFTQDLANAFDKLYSTREESKIVAMNNSISSGYFYPKKVISTINDQDEEQYREAARQLNAESQVKIVHIQHEYGIYGGGYGSLVLSFMKELTKPSVLTMHTVLPGPNPQLKEVTISLCELAHKIVVMTNLSKDILVKDYGVPAEKIAVIPHGIHPVAYSTPDAAQKELRLEGKKVILTFGLLSRGKGIEYAIDALPDVVKKHPEVVYVIAGATHPDVLRKEGDVYRNSLIEKIAKLNLEKNVLFFNKFLSLAELLTMLKACDIYLATPLDPNQAVSGTLSYALGTGRPVVATKFAQAREIITEDVGRLVDFKNSDQIRDALLALLDNKNETELMGKKAYFRTRAMEWRNVIISYMREYTNLVPELAKREKNIPPFKLRQLIKLTDNFGIFQFAKLTEPDPAWGYTLDDNARALIVAIKAYEKLNMPVALKLAKVYLNFIHYVQKPGGGFENYVNSDKTFHLERNSQENLSDANSRALYALAYTAASKELPFELRHTAANLFKANLKIPEKLEYCHAAAFYIKAFDLWLRVEHSGEIEASMRTLCDFLIEKYEQNHFQNWEWFEDTMTYSNGLLPEALIIAYKRFQNKKYLDVATVTLEFLLSYSFQDKVCVPIGHKGWFKRGGQKHIFDQQPEEVAALVHVLHRMISLTQNPEYKQRLRDTFNWFLGNNILGQVIYDQETGGCYDGLGEHEVNLNQGAESTVVYLDCRLTIE